MSVTFNEVGKHLAQQAIDDFLDHQAPICFRSLFSFINLHLRGLSDVTDPLFKNGYHLSHDMKKCSLPGGWIIGSKYSINQTGSSELKTELVGFIVNKNSDGSVELRVSLPGPDGKIALSSVPSSSALGRIEGLDAVSLAESLPLFGQKILAEFHEALDGEFRRTIDPDRRRSQMHAVLSAA